ncbi:hypothetical protein BH23PSE1_BH23PSE1_10390 [soil metagenome]
MRAAARLVLVCEHAGRRIPRSLGSLGLGKALRARQFMWNIGALALARALAARLDAPLVLQPWSRMVCDCNRPTDAPDFIPGAGEGTPVPGNLGLPPEARAARIAAIWRPFPDRLAAFLAARPGPGALVTVHSFTPALDGASRPWPAGVLFARDHPRKPARGARAGGNLGIRQVIVAGLLTDRCVDMAVRDGADLGFYMRCAADACTSRTQAQHAAALAAFGGYCRVETVAELLAGLAAGASR